MCVHVLRCVCSVYLLLLRRRVPCCAHGQRRHLGFLQVRLPVKHREHERFSLSHSQLGGFVVF